MKFITALTFAASVSAAAVETRQATSKLLNNFAAACIPHSTFCEMSFSIESDPSLPESHCAARRQSTNGKLPAFDDGKCEDNAAYTWGIVDTQDGGFRFAISYPLNSRSNITFCSPLPASNFKIVDGGSVQTQEYIGATSFDVSVGACA